MHGTYTTMGRGWRVSELTGCGLHALATCREAQASCQRSEKALAAAVEALRTQVEGGCADIVASNRRFDAEHLKLFEGEAVAGASSVGL